MPNVILSPVGGPGQQFFDNNGVLLSGGKLYTYLAGTTTPATTYTDADGVTPQLNPIILDAAGRVPNNGMWLIYGTQYKVITKTSVDVTISTYDNLPGATVRNAIVAAQATADATNASLATIANTFVLAIRATSQQSLPANVTTKLIFNSETTDPTNSYNPATGDFTVPATGTYLFNAGAFILPVTTPLVVGDALSISVFKAGSPIAIIARFEVPTTTTASVFLHGEALIKLTAADVVNIQFVNGSTTKAFTLEVSTIGSYLAVARLN